MGQYCTKIWDAYKEVDAAHKTVAQSWNAMAHKGDLVQGKKMIADMAVKLESLQEVWDNAFIVLPDGRKLFGPEYDALLELKTINHLELTEEKLFSSIQNITSGWASNFEFPGYHLPNITPLANLTNLNELGLSHCNITSLTPLSKMTKLTCLWLFGNQITDVTPLANLSNLTKLGLSKNQITDLYPLANLTNLTELVLNNDQITDISPLANMTNLTKIWLYENPITDLTPLRYLRHLQGLYLSNTHKYNNPEQLKILDEIRSNNPGIDIAA